MFCFFSMEVAWGCQIQEHANRKVQFFEWLVFDMNLDQPWSLLTHPLGFRVYTNVQTQFILGCPYFHGRPWPHSSCLCFLSSNVLRDAWICCRILLGFPPTPWNPIPKKAEFPSELSCSILTIRYQNIVVQIVIYIYIDYCVCKFDLMWYQSPTKCLNLILFSPF